MKIIKRKIDMTKDELAIIAQVKKAIPDFAECWSKMYDMIIKSPSFANYIDSTKILIYLNLYEYYVLKTRRTDCYRLYLVLMLINIKAIESDDCEPYVLEYDEYENPDEKQHKIVYGYNILNAKHVFNIAKSYVESFGTDKYKKLLSELDNEITKEYAWLKIRIVEFEEKLSGKDFLILNEIIDELKAIYQPFDTAFGKIKHAYDKYIYEDRLLVNSPQELRKLAKIVFNGPDDEIKAVVFKHGTVVCVPIDITVGTTVEKTAKRIIVHGKFNDFSDSATADIVAKVGESDKGVLSWAASQRGGSTIYYWKTSYIDDEIAELYRKKDAEILDIDCII